MTFQVFSIYTIKAENYIPTTFTEEELDAFSDFFHLAYDQICKSADDIKKIANISEQQ